MARVLLFHHAHGRTPGFLTFADDLRAAGHTVHAPDLYGGRTFRELREGVAYAGQVGFAEIIRRGSDAARDLPADIVYAGFSLGVMPAQALAQTRPGARGALLFQGCVSPSEFGTSWPQDVPLQIHTMDADAWTEEDRAVAQASSSRFQPQSCSSTRVRPTCSPTRASATTTRRPPFCSRNARSPSCTGLVSSGPGSSSAASEGRQEP